MRIKLTGLLIIIFSFVAGIIFSAEPKVEKKKEGTKERLKVGFVYVGPVGDAGWTYSHDVGRRAIEKKFPNVETKYIESVSEADVERVITNLAQKDFNLIFTTSFGFMDPTLKVAGKFPKTIFMHCSGYKTAKNMGNYFGRMYQGKYLSGIVAGKMTKTNKIGFIGPHAIPEVIRHIDAFTLGVRAVNSNATVKVIWTGAWFDPTKEKEAANSFFDAGCDIVATDADSVAPLQEAEKRGKYAIGYDSDSSHFAPKAFLTAPIWDWGIYYIKVIQEVLDGKFKPASDMWGMETGILKLAPFGPMVTDDVKKAVEEAKKKICSGEFKVFEGPIKNQKGELVLTKGQVMSDKDLLDINFFVEGIEGSIPK